MYKRKYAEDEIENEFYSSDDSSSSSHGCLEAFATLIKKTKRSGEESIGGEAVELPVNPGLYIENFGDVPLPINHLVAGNLIKIFEQAPYGLNEQTLMDTTVRDTYQLDPSRVKIKNPEWNAKLNLLLKRVEEGLGSGGSIEAKLYKLLLYTPGGHFKKHRDTEKEKNMFATLVIQLPSSHVGGELVIHNLDNTETIHDFGQKSGNAAYMPHFVAHYADVEHEILQVKEGYRLALVYSLCRVENDSIENSLNHTIASYESVMECLKNMSGQNLAILLEHQYTHASLSHAGVKTLKGVDYDRFTLIKSANAKLPPEEQIVFYIAHASLVVDVYDISGYTRKHYKKYCMWEEDGRKELIKELYDATGKPCLSDRPLLGLEFLTKIVDVNKNTTVELSNNPKVWGDVDEEKVQGYTGNAGATKTTKYSKYLLILWRKTDEFDAFLKIDNNYAADYLYRNIEIANSESSYKEKLNKLISIIEIDNCQTINQKSKLNMLAISVKIKDLDLCRMIFKYLNYEENMIQHIISVIVAFGWEDLVESFKLLFLPVSLANISINCDLVKELFQMNLQEVSFKCFKVAVLPALETITDVFKKREIHGILDQLFEYRCKYKMKLTDERVSHLFKILETMHLFKNENMTNEMNQYKTLAITYLNQACLKQLLSTIIEENNSLSVLPVVRQLFEVRLNWLMEQLKTVTRFSWYMPGTTRHREVDAFLRSEFTQQFVYSGCFHGIDEARKFERSHGGLNDGYSLSITSSGCGKRAQVTLVKTREYYEETVRQREEYKQELETIKTMLNM